MTMARAACATHMQRRILERTDITQAPRLRRRKTCRRQRRAKARKVTGSDLATAQATASHRSASFQASRCCGTVDKGGDVGRGEAEASGGEQKLVEQSSDLGPVSVQAGARWPKGLCCGWRLKHPNTWKPCSVAAALQALKGHGAGIPQAPPSQVGELRMRVGEGIRRRARSSNFRDLSRPSTRCP